MTETSIDLNLLLKAKGIDPRDVIVMRHRPSEPKLAKVIGWLAVEKPDVFNAYQQTQGPTVEKAMLALSEKGYVASFIGHGSGKALFIGLYKIGKATPMTEAEYWAHPAYKFMKEFDMNGFVPGPGHEEILWFDLQQIEDYSDWKGKLVISWPPPDRSWWRRAERNTMPVLAIHEESVLEAQMPAWDAINLSWEELSVLPSKWKAAMSQWRGIYYIFDETDGKGYVGSAYGASNIYGRWAVAADRKLSHG